MKFLFGSAIIGLTLTLNLAISPAHAKSDSVICGITTPCPVSPRVNAIQVDKYVKFAQAEMRQQKRAERQQLRQMRKTERQQMRTDRLKMREEKKAARQAKREEMRGEMKAMRQEFRENMQAKRQAFRELKHTNSF